MRQEFSEKIAEAHARTLMDEVFFEVENVPLTPQTPNSEEKLYGRQQTMDILKECEIRIAEHAATNLLQECSLDAIKGAND